LINNSTKEIPVISIVAALYNKDDKLITTCISAAEASDLPGGDRSAFSINLYNLGNDVVDHFILFLVVRHNCCELWAKSIQTGHNSGQRIHTY